ASVRRVVLLRRPAGVRHAVPLVEGDCRAALAVNARDRDRVRDRGAQVEEVRMPAADALVLEVAVDDRQLQTLAGVAGLGARGRVVLHDRLAHEAAFEGAGRPTTIAVTQV